MPYRPYPRCRCLVSYAPALIGVVALTAATASGQTCQWQGTGGGSVESLAVFEGELYAGGFFTQVGDTSANHIAVWNGTTWDALGNGRNNIVFAMHVWDEDGLGPIQPALYTGGVFSTAGGFSANNVARWDGATWSSVGTGTDLGGVNAMTEFNGDLIAAGSFQMADGNQANRIAKWDGVEWMPLVGPTANGLNSTVSCVLAHDDGSGSKLYVGGNFVTAGGVSASRIARWTGTAWEAVGSGTNGNVLALAEYNGEFYAGGVFTTAGAAPAPRIAVWDGSSWDNVGGGMVGGTATVNSLYVHDDGSGSKLYAGGQFTEAFGVAGSQNFARWNGATWEAVSGGGVGGAVLAMIEGDGGAALGSGLYIGGSFSQAGGVDAECMANWDAPTWSAVGGCVETDCNANGVPDSQDIANGDSSDCNLNAIPDECDLDEPFSDLNFNGILDECEPDCNNSGLPDDLDIQLGFSDDLNENGIPDECELACPGDTNNDGAVDVDDLNNVILDWGTNGAGNGGDIAGPSNDQPDGIVDVNDLNAIIVNWGLCPAPLATGVMPGVASAAAAAVTEGAAETTSTTPTTVEATTTEATTPTRKRFRW